MSHSDVTFDSGEHEQRPAVLIGEVRGKAAVEGDEKAFFVALFDEVLCAAIGQWVSDAMCLCRNGGRAIDNVSCTNAHKSS